MDDIKLITQSVDLLNKFIQLRLKKTHEKKPEILNAKLPSHQKLNLLTVAAHSLRNPYSSSPRLLFPDPAQVKRNPHSSVFFFP